jgi:hypothetical protein
MKPPPLLLGAALLFWGWQSDFLVVGAMMAVVLESARFVKARWELSDEDFARIWTFCSVLALGAVVYAFTANEGPARFGDLLRNPSGAAQSSAGTSSARTASALFRWMPMIFFPFIAAQTFSARETVPLVAISLILRRRLRRAKERGGPLPPERNVRVDFPYFAVCLVGASVHPSENASFFWGLCGLLTWALWAQRSRRFGFFTWATALGLAVGLGFAGQHGIAQFQNYISQLNPAWLLRLRSARGGTDPFWANTAIGRGGALKLSPRIVIRLEPKGRSAAPTYLREASYRVFDRWNWFPVSSKAAFVNVQETPPNSGVWPLLPSRTNGAVVNIACYLEGRGQDGRAGLLPLPSGTSLLEKLFAFRVDRNDSGAVLATGPGLVDFDAIYAPGPTMDADPKPIDLNVSPREVPALEQIASELKLHGQSKDQALRTLSRFFASNFTYSTWQPLTKSANTDETPLSRFLLSTHKGHCEYFATATTLLLRQAGHPARYAVGYFVHEQAGRKYVVRERDAHAWCLVWDARTKTWQDFDTTPASWVVVEAQRASWWQWFSDLWSWIRYQSAKVWWGQTNLRQYLLWALVPVLALLLYQIVFRRGRRRQRAKKREEDLAMVWPGLDSEFYLLEKKLAARGAPRLASESLLDWLERATAAADAKELQASLRELLQLHYRYRFDPQGLSVQERQALREQAKACLDKLIRGAARKP